MFGGSCGHRFSGAKPLGGQSVSRFVQLNGVVFSTRAAVKQRWAIAPFLAHSNEAKDARPGMVDYDAVQTAPDSYGIAGRGAEFSLREGATP